MVLKHQVGVSMIRAEQLSKTFIRNEEKKKTSFLKPQKDKTEFFAVDHISLEVKKGEILGVLGPNGAGKTTLLRMLGKLMEPTDGKVIITDFDGNEITDTIEMKKQIGYLSGNTKLYLRLSSRELLAMLGEIYGLTKEECHKRTAEIFEVLDMTSFADNRIEKLSTGQTQRISIARCLIHKPAIYIFDEPTLGLDIISSDAIIEFMQAEKEQGKSVVYSTHYMEEAQFLCDRIIMMNNGKIIAEGTPKSLIEQTNTNNIRETFHEILKRGGNE